ncbi:CoA transferase [Nocardioides sp. YIM 152315]|uniref:CoA transferase n=1 Tax=Nocardioides sp. YIM 152315 TaxID=3031760 RepID=UPI0023DC0BBA|nr:CoA transferase [Nocardioides sp. YIM 152315]MDF1602252.1 CoA transferase [Nocardioides sp. YIM 152315]
MPERPLVVDFTSLWAGPLCAHLLGRCDVDVVKVESRFRPDGARQGSAAFYDLLHAGHSAVAVSPDDERDRERLRALVERADLVLEASRPRALERWGLSASEVVDAGTTWLSITARGRCSDTVGFGDDVAADAGLLAWESGEPRLCGDAIADPLTGAVAAATAGALLADDRAKLVEVSMLDVARAALLRPGCGDPEVRQLETGTWVATGADGRSHPVQLPRARHVEGAAASVGRDNDRWLR